MTFVDAERAALCDTLLEFGPSAPTLCEGWDTYDLAAHLWVRENLPLNALLVMVDPRKTQEMALRAAKQENSFLKLVSDFRKGPQGANLFRIPGVNRLANTVEFFIHHEDIRRAGSSPLPPRELDESAIKTLTTNLRRSAPMLFRKAPFGVDLTVTGGETIPVKRRRKVGIRGDAGEILLWAFGRTSVAQVELAGRPGDVELLRSTLGV